MYFEILDFAHLSFNFASLSSYLKVLHVLNTLIDEIELGGSDDLIFIFN